MFNKTRGKWVIKATNKGIRWKNLNDIGKILENQYEMEKESAKLKNIYQSEMDNYAALKIELNEYKLENERLRPQCGQILILQEKLEDMTEKNKRLEDRCERLMSEIHGENSFTIINSENKSRNSTMINETLNQLSNNIKIKNDQLMNSQTKY